MLGCNCSVKVWWQQPIKNETDVDNNQYVP